MSASIPATERQLISSGSPFEAVMGYSRAVRVGNSVSISGTAPQWPDGHVDPDVEIQARRCFEIIGDALERAGARFDDVVRTRIFLVDAADFDAVAKVHGEVFVQIRPANSTIVVAALLNAAWHMEIEVDAIIAPR
jgi:enamine deaminase RidA (YjgF/YER057c/UK114 family)